MCQPGLCPQVQLQVEQAAEPSIRVVLAVANPGPASARQVQHTAAGSAQVQGQSWRSMPDLPGFVGRIRGGLTGEPSPLSPPPVLCKGPCHNCRRVPEQSTLLHTPLPCQLQPSLPVSQSGCRCLCSSACGVGHALNV